MENTDTNVNPAVFSKTYFLTAGESNARGEMPTTLMAERLIEIATNHANNLGIGYATLAPLGVGWVLSRLGVRMMRVPRINEYYTITTWIESWNRLFSERCFRFDDADGNVIGWGRTTWATIDFATRKAVDLTRFASNGLLGHGMECGLPRMRNHTPTDCAETVPLTFRFMDLDFNRHVNSVRYIEHILNLWPLEHYDRYRVESFEIAYRRECLAGQTVMMAVGSDGSTVDLLRDGERVVTAVVGFVNDPVKL